MQLDFDEAAVFLRTLDPSATAFQFQTFDDVKGRKRTELARCWSATLADAWPEIERLNAAGAGIFYTVNATDGAGRKLENVKRVRAVWHEDDGDGFNVQPGDDAAVMPTIAVASSPGKFHRIWLVEGMTPEQHAEALRAQVARGSDKAAGGINRVLRLPGTYHQKGEPFLVRTLPGEMLGDGWGAYSPRDIARAYPAPVAPSPAERIAPVVTSQIAEIAKALFHIPPTSVRADWLHVGMMLHECGEVGFDLWGAWSQLGENYSAEDQRRVWDSIKDDKANAATVDTLFRHAAGFGYSAPGTSEAEVLADFAPVAPEAATPEAATATLLKFLNELTLDDVVKRRESALIEGLIFPDSYAITYGPSTAGKTFVALDMSMHIALGRKWRGRKTQSVPVLYVPLEGRMGFEMRVMAAMKRFGHPGKFFAMLRPDVKTTKDEAGAIGTRAIIAACNALSAQCGGAKVGLVVVDTLGRAMAGDNEDNTAEMSMFVDKMKAIQLATGACVMVVHHTNKSGTMRGNALNFGSADTVLRVTRAKNEKTHEWENAPRRVFLEKSKDGEDGKVLFHFELEDVELKLDDGTVVETSKVVTEVPAPELPETSEKKKLSDWA